MLLGTRKQLLPNSVVGWLGRVSLWFETCQCFQMNNLVANFGSRLFILIFLSPCLALHPLLSRPGGCRQSGGGKRTWGHLRPTSLWRSAVPASAPVLPTGWRRRYQGSLGHSLKGAGRVVCRPTLGARAVTSAWEGTLATQPFVASVTTTASCALSARRQV